MLSRRFSAYSAVESKAFRLREVLTRERRHKFMIKTADNSNVQTRRLYAYAVNHDQSTLSSTTKSICFLQIHCI